MTDPAEYGVLTYCSQLFLTVFVLLQLSVFFLVTAVGLWTTWLLNGPLLHISMHTPLYKALFIFTIVVSLGSMSHPPAIAHGRYRQTLPPWIIAVRPSRLSYTGIRGLTVTTGLVCCAARE